MKESRADCLAWSDPGTVGFLLEHTGAGRWELRHNILRGRTRMKTRHLATGLLIVIVLLLSALLTGNPAPTRAALEPVQGPLGPNTPFIITSAGVELSPGYDQTVHPGDIVTYTHTLTNTGSTTDTYTLAVSSSQGWPVSLLSLTGALSLPLQLEAGLTTTFLISLSVPTAAVSGTVDTAVITATSETSPTMAAVAADTTMVETVTRYVYLPLVLKRWPPVPDAPVLIPISIPGSYGDYTVSWNSAYLAITYTLEEDDSVAFSNPMTRYSGSGTSWSAWGKLIGTYYYRVKATNSWGDSSWSNIQSVTVLPPDVPVLNPISNPDGGGNYTLTWNLAYRATSYALQEDDNAAFSSPTTQYTGWTSWSASNNTPGTYYYRVKAINASGESGWSNMQSVIALPGVYGRVTYQGTSIVGTPINLHFDISSIATTTQADGTYYFPNLTPGKQYQAVYDNSADPSFVPHCPGPLLTSYSAGARMAGGDFDIANIPLISPLNGTTIALPYTFQWTPRLGVPSDSYRLEMFAGNGATWWDTPPLGYVGQYALNSLPYGLSYGTRYWWRVWVGAPGEFCSSFERTVTFSGGTVSLEDTVQGPRHLHNEDIQP